MTPMWNTDLPESVSENFMMKEFPADKQFIIWWLLIDKKQEHKHWVLEDKLENHWKV
jgi:hypothetical protein